MNKSFLKFATDFGPLAIFFYYYYNNDKNLSVAIPPPIVATLVTLTVVWYFEKKIPKYKFLYTFFKTPVIFSLFSFFYEIIAFFLYLKNKKQLLK